MNGVFAFVNGRTIDIFLRHATDNGCVGQIVTSRTDERVCERPSARHTPDLNVVVANDNGRPGITADP